MNHLGQRRFHLCSPAVVLIAACVCLASARQADAAVHTWTGAVSSLWSDSNNWMGGKPAAGDDLVFPAAPVRLTSTNDLAAGTPFKSMTIADSYVIGGNGIELGSGGVQLTAAGAVQPHIGLDITLVAPQTWKIPHSPPFLFVEGDIHLDGQMLTLTVAGTLHISGGIAGIGGLTKWDTGVLILSGPNSYSGQTEINAGTLMALSATALGVADGTLANGTVVNGNVGFAGSLSLVNVAIGNEAMNFTGPGTSANGALQNGGHSSSSIAGPITLSSDTTVNLLSPSSTLILGGLISGPGKLRLSNPGSLVLLHDGNTFGGIDMYSGIGSQTSTLVAGANFAVPLGTPLEVLSGTTFRVIPDVDARVGALSGAGTVDLTDPTCNIVITGASTTAFTGTIIGKGKVFQNGTGHTTFSTSPSFTGEFRAYAGTITFSGSTPASASILAKGRFQLAPSAAIGPVSLANGHFELQGNATVTSTIASPITLNGPGIFDVMATAPASLPTLSVHGPITLGQPTLSLHLPAGFTPAIGTIYTLIDNDGSDAIAGTFNGLPEGTKLTTNGGGVWFRLSYVGGSGNDVTLTVVPEVREYLFSEGATSAFFTTELAFTNANDVEAPVHITFLKDDGTTVAIDRTLAAKSHALIKVNDIAEMEAANFSTVIKSIKDLPLAIERTMSWDGSRYGAHTEHAVDAPSTTWYFAEGSQGFFHTYLLLANPQSTANTATVEYLRENEAPVTRVYDLAPTSRRTIDAGEDPELINRSFGMTVTFTQPGAAERAMYFGSAPLFDGGHESAGATAPSDTWYLAEGATGPFFETFVLIANPNDTDVAATLTFLTSSGAPVTVNKLIPARRRVTVNIEQEDASLANAAVSTRIVATGPILVERSQYWPDPAPSWYEAHNSFGLTTLGGQWAIADGRVGTVDGVTSAQTFILLANPGNTTANVSVTFLRENGAAALTKTFAVAPNARFNVAVGTGTDVPELTNERFGAVVTADQPIAVEHALYWDANGQLWAAGTNAVGTRLP